VYIKSCLEIGTGSARTCGLVCVSRPTSAGVIDERRFGKFFVGQVSSLSVICLEGQIGQDRLEAYPTRSQTLHVGSLKARTDCPLPANSRHVREQRNNRRNKSAGAKSAALPYSLSSVLRGEGWGEGPEAGTRSDFTFASAGTARVRLFRPTKSEAGTLIY
jgi:hypothetical protein